MPLEAVALVRALAGGARDPPDALARVKPR